jgi:hypothetical protein
LVILAAGIGTRFRGAKQLETVGPGGEILADYAAFDASRHGFGRVVLVTREGIDPPLVERAERWKRLGLEVAFAHQHLDDLPGGRSAPPWRLKPWGTVQAVLAARAHVKGPFAVANADDFYGSQGYAVLATHFASRPDELAVVGYRLGDTLSAYGGVSRGLCHVTADGMLKSVVELREVARKNATIQGREPSGEVITLTGDETVSMNLWGFWPTVFESLERTFVNFLELEWNDADAECLIPGAVGAVIARRSGRVRVLKAQSRWFGLTHPADVADARTALAGMVAAGEYPRVLFAA